MALMVRNYSSKRSQSTLRLYDLLQLQRVVMAESATGEAEVYEEGPGDAVGAQAERRKSQKSDTRESAERQGV
jgi:hypothetical protein